MTDLYKQPPPPHSYVLEDRRPRQAKSLGEWVEFYENTAARILARDEIDGVRIITAFLTIDDDFGMLGKTPKLFGTMVFGRPWDEQRCETWDEALAQHQRAVAQIGVLRIDSVVR